MLLTLSMLGSVCILPADDFSLKSFKNASRQSNNLDPDQARHLVGPDLDPNCLQRLSEDNKGRYRWGKSKDSNTPSQVVVFNFPYLLKKSYKDAFFSIYQEKTIFISLLVAMVRSSQLLEKLELEDFDLKALLIWACGAF